MDCLFNDLPSPGGDGHRRKWWQKLITYTVTSVFFFVYVWHLQRVPVAGIWFFVDNFLLHHILYSAAMLCIVQVYENDVHQKYLSSLQCMYLESQIAVHITLIAFVIWRHGLYACKTPETTTTQNKLYAVLDDGSLPSFLNMLKGK